MHHYTFMNRQKSIPLLKILLITYILLTLTFAGLNYGYAPGADDETAGTIHFLWELFENEGKSFLMLLAVSVGLLNLRERDHPGGSISRGGRNRRTILLSFLAAALVIHIILPWVSGNREIYFIAMPLPWTTSGLQIAAEGSNFGTDLLPCYGDKGISFMIYTFLGLNLVILLGTLVEGRRFQCSRICLFNGFIAELFDSATPLFGKKRPPGRGLLQLAGVIRPLLFALALLFTLIWLFQLIAPGLMPPPLIAGSAALEEYEYLFFDLMAMLLFWVLLGPRTYCLYCPAGTALGLLGRHLSRQRIETGLSRCTSCGACSRVCPVGLDPMAAALEGKPLRSSRCIGCRRCEVACPTGNLEYRTALVPGRAGSKG